MANWKITVRGAEQASAEIQDAIRQGQRDGLELAGVRGEVLVRQNVVTPFFGKPAAVGFGVLANAITHGFETAPGIFGREVIFAQPPADQYAAYVETGTGPHFPPIHALLAWVRQKFGVNDEGEAKRIAYLVARKIARRGTPGHGMFARAAQVLFGELQGIFERTIGAALERLRGRAA